MWPLRFPRSLTSRQDPDRRRREAARADRARRLALAQSASTLMPYLTVELRGLVFVVGGPEAEQLVANRNRSDFVVLERTTSVLAAGAAHGVDGRTLVDVGANIGTTSLTALACSGFRRSLAIEPDPENARLLRSNAALNGLEERVTLIEAAAGSRPGRAEFTRGRYEDGRWRSGTGRLRSEAPSTLTVEVITLDGLVEAAAVDPPEVGLLWLDVQGHELDVLRGARSFVAVRVPIVLALRPLELTHEDDLDRLVSLLAGGYEGFVDLRRPNLEPPWEPEYRPLERLRDYRGQAITTDVLAVPRLPG